MTPVAATLALPRRAARVTDSRGARRDRCRTARPLLQALLRHALLREHAEAAARLLADSGRTAGRAAARRRARRPGAGAAADRDLDVAAHPAAAGRHRRRDGRRPAGRPRRLPAPPRCDRSAELRAALTALAGAEPRHGRTAAPGGARRHVLPPRRVGDVARHPAARRAARRPADRAVARRLRLGRGAAPAPATARSPTSRPDEPGPLLAAAGDPGFILAPSLDQASTAALLRNAHLAHGGDRRQPVRHRPLTSDRVRLAERLLRRRAAGPARSARCSATTSSAACTRRPRRPDRRLLVPADGSAAGTDGDRGGRPAGAGRRSRPAATLAGRQAESCSPTSVTPGRRTPAEARAVGRRARLARPASDGGADAVTAESVFQLVRGNLARAATLDDVAGGHAPPPLSS